MQGLLTTMFILGELLTKDAMNFAKDELSGPIVTGNHDAGNFSGLVQGKKKIVSDEEVEEISQTLQNIKSVAIATQQELDVQSDNIDNLTGTVDRANQRVNEHIKRIKTLT